MKQLRFVILIMLIMLLLCPAARAVQTPGSAQAQQTVTWKVQAHWP